MHSWNESMKTLLDNLRKGRVITNEKVYNSMLQVDRADFTGQYPYADHPQSINYNATISAPHMHAYALEYLSDYLKPGNHVLDVGSGSGYLTVALSKMMDDKGVVVGVEHIKELYNKSIDNISKHHSNLLKEGKVILKNCDGKKGFKEMAPYQAIHVGAAAAEIPNDLYEQLDKNGRMFIPVGGQYESQYIYVIDKNSDGNITEKRVMSVNYVPLTTVEKQIGRKY